MQVHTEDAEHILAREGHVIGMTYVTFPPLIRLVMVLVRRSGTRNGLQCAGGRGWLNGQPLLLFVDQTSLVDKIITISTIVVLTILAVIAVVELVEWLRK